MQPADVLSRPARPPDLTLTYGRPDLVADLWLPPADPAQAAVPLIVFLSFQRFFVQGITAGAVK